ncbi:MAG TPA: hypothetical protein RMH85_19490 [Polyangiaceae bacterium LLY-WYZ-15_(1-7)]|nr:hypothetical protein [Sandaracinus sp.]HJL00647.1 hypothetical protein [Polyangiaceae bacterium LLY-WYZ-15_(1-7)]MBJ70622.1 hypothetical protein [Sandaracinus sp.]HJL10694.1 hypothetical protein [Polyangiaceae bacterium LLY-WYZ-15_(1-7)]HJL25446.1 hypothetical protein [Polyangiaceae bacterium LLY-WYZ-15_(1-7)]
MATARTLELTDPIKRRLLHLRYVSGTKTDPTLDAALVEDVEKTLGLKLGDNLLALLANGDVALEGFDVRLQNVVSLTKELHASGGPRGMVGLGRDPGGDVLVAAPLGGKGVAFFDTRDRSIDAVPLEAWLDELVGTQLEQLREDESDDKARAFKSVHDEDLGGFRPALVVDETPAKRVSHPKFGGGAILRELDGGAKLEVRFDDGSKRTLLARFLTRQGGGEEPSGDAGAEA